MTQPEPTPIHRHRQEALFLGRLLILTSIFGLIYVIFWMSPTGSRTKLVPVLDDVSARSH